MERAAQAVQAVWRDLRAIDWWFAGAPLAVFATLFAVCLVTRADLAVSGLFFSADTGAWPLKHVEPFGWCYRCGCKPAVFVGVTGLVFGMLALVLPTLQRARKPSLFLALTLIIGPGLLVNVVLKPNVARPRPYQTTDFGGAEQFAYIGGPSSSGNHSFPSGHASMGFFFMTPALLFYRQRPGLASAVFLVGLSYGGLVGAARIVQGAHFLSDVLGSALCVWGTAVLVLFCRRCVKQLTVGNLEDTLVDATILKLPEAAALREERERRKAA